MIPPTCCSSARERSAGLDHIINSRIGKRGVGFGAEIASANSIDQAVFGEVLPEDLVKFGLIPEFIGRLPGGSERCDLDRDALIEILSVPKNALVRQFGKFFELDGVELEFTDEALNAVADLALVRGTGARGLRSILEDVLLNTMYDLPSREDIGRVIIDEDVVRNQANPTLILAADIEQRTALELSKAAAVSR